MALSPDGRFATLPNRRPPIGPEDIVATTSLKSARTSIASPAFVVAGIAGIVVAGLVAAILRENGGTFAYMIDDPYIHLSMAEQILRGEYGVNAGEPAAAASSILFPYLVAALMALGCGSLAPLVINVVSLLGIVVALAALLREVAGEPPGGRQGAAAFVVLALCAALNVVGLVFCGMEHSLHIALTTLALLGVLRFHRSGEPPAWWLAVLWLEPLVRYEGLAVLVAGAILLALNGRAYTAALLVVLGLIPLVGFSAYLTSLGLPPLPSSVLVKGEESGIGDGTAGLLASLAANFLRNLQTHDGLVLALCLGLLLARLVRFDLTLRPLREVGAQVALFGAFVVLAHLVLGRFPTFNRYSAYALALGIMCVLVAHGGLLRRLLREGSAGLVAGFALALMLVLPTSTLQGLLTVVCASNIYRQHYQMHRFVTEFWRAPIAVNDLGWVSYQNPHYVLDLWGLGSEEARRHRKDPGSGWMAELAARKGVPAAAIYDTWFVTRPAGWTAVATLKLEGRLISADTDTVTFYATRADQVAVLKARLEAFAPTLPSGASMRFL
jgi:hypothetical protein